MNQPKKAVVLLVPGFPANEDDSTCIPFLQEFVEALVETKPDISIHVITFQYPRVRKIYQWKGATIYSLHGQSRKFPFRILTWLRAVQHFKKIKKQYTIIAIQSVWLTETALVGTWLSRISNSKHVAYAVGQDVLKTNKYLRFLNYSQIHVVASTESMATRFRLSTGKKAATIIPQGLNKNLLHTPTQPRTIDIIGVGNLIPLKNYSVFIDTIDSLKNDFPALKSFIAGKGEQMKELQRKIASNNLESNIELLGELSYNRVLELMGKSRIFLHPSTYEGQCTAIMEALAMGCIVVCFNIGIIQVEGKVFACNTQADMVGTLKNLLSSEMSHERVLLHTSTDMAKEFFKIYET